jgi:hypothetical protein
MKSNNFEKHDNQLRKIGDSALAITGDDRLIPYQ